MAGPVGNLLLACGDRRKKLGKRKPIRGLANALFTTFCLSVIKLSPLSSAHCTIMAFLPATGRSDPAPNVARTGAWKEARVLARGDPGGPLRRLPPGCQQWRRREAGLKAPLCQPRTPRGSSQGRVGYKVPQR